MNKISELIKSIYNFLFAHKLYVNFHALVISLVLSVLLIQAGSLFLKDYTSGHLALLRAAYNDQLLWATELYQLRFNENIKTQDFDKFNINMADLASNEYGWLRKQHDTALSQRYGELVALQGEFSAARTQKRSIGELVMLGEQVVAGYNRLSQAATEDIEAKQSVVSILQLICMFLVLCNAAGVMLVSWNVLIERLGRIIALLPESMIVNSANENEDEYDVMERVVAEMSASLEGIQVETSWVNKTSTERMRKMNLSLDFLFRLVKLIGSSGISEITLKKTLYSMERTMNANNVALVFSENGSSISAQRALYSSHWPAMFTEEMFDASIADSVNQITKVVNGKTVQCSTIPLPGPGGWLGLLLVETEEHAFFEDSEFQLLEVTAQLLALSMGFQAREQETRRVALLEERAVIARELHDSLAQSLSYMKFQLARLQLDHGEKLVECGASEIVNDMREGLDNAYKELRELLTTFRVQMDIRGLDHVLEEAIEEFSQRSSLNVVLDNRLDECILSVNQEFHLLHVVREALSNIVRHSGARRATISLVLQSTGDVIVTIDDDGKGLTFDEKKPHHYGLAIMTERAYCLGGAIEVLPRRRGGTRVRLVFHP